MARSSKKTTRTFKVELSQLVRRTVEVTVTVELQDPSWADADPYQDTNLYDVIQDACFDKADQGWQEDICESNMDITETA